MTNRWPPRIDGQIDAREVVVCPGAVVEKDVVIRGKDGPAERVVLGPFSFVGSGTRVLVPRFSIGDYSKLHAGSFVHGTESANIGRNCWIGGNVVLDSMGGLDIEDNVGIGAGSQLWTHIQFGDVVQGCRFKSAKPMRVGRDAWLVGHCIVSPVAVGERSMALAGSVVTADMLPDRVYGGVPARDLTEKVGRQFEPLSAEEKVRRLEGFIEQFGQRRPELAPRIRAVTEIPTDREPDIAYFDVIGRCYNRTYSPAEVEFLRFVVPLAKFCPDDVPRWNPATVVSVDAG